MKTLFLISLFIKIIPFTLQAQIARQVSVTGGVIQVRANLKNSDGTPARGVMTYLSVVAIPYDLRTSVSDENGVVEYLLPSLPGNAKLVFQADPSQKSQVLFQTGRPLISVQADTASEEGYVYPDTSIFYGTPDGSYLLDDYTRFATLEEVFREFVSEVKVTKQGNDINLAVLNKPLKVFFDNRPLVLLDGVPVFDLNRMMEIDPLKIRAIEVVARRYYLGRLMSYGIISLFTFDNDMADYTLPSSTLVTGVRP